MPRTIHQDGLLRTLTLLQSIRESFCFSVCDCHHMNATRRREHGATKSALLSYPTALIDPRSLYQRHHVSVVTDACEKPSYVVGDFYGLAVDAFTQQRVLKLRDEIALLLAPTQK
jgi:hypothetical protein